ncbi:hypothetical protein B1H10_07345 [candidate division KSB1 bacterium 4484_188]|nr:MAG: hypothetical protein B1H10_07345 [candidate division KSB1 bacterium 4484_188]
MGPGLLLTAFALKAGVAWSDIPSNRKKTGIKQNSFRKCLNLRCKLILSSHLSIQYKILDLN